MREKWIRFMQGRYGNDDFSRFTLVIALVLIIISLFVRNPIALQVTNLGGLALLIYTYFRMMSKNISARHAENQKYLNKTMKIRRKFNTIKRDWEQSKDYHIYKCPSCRQKIRVPKGKGKIEITCPKCKEKFVKRS